MLKVAKAIKTRFAFGQLTMFNMMSGNRVETEEGGAESAGRLDPQLSRIAGQSKSRAAVFAGPIYTNLDTVNLEKVSKLKRRTTLETIQPGTKAFDVKPNQLFDDIKTDWQENPRKEGQMIIKDEPVTPEDLPEIFENAQLVTAVRNHMESPELNVIGL